MSQDTRTKIEEAILDLHREDHAASVVTGWVTCYVASDTEGNDLIAYVRGQGTNRATALGLVELVSDVLHDYEED